MRNLTWLTSLVLALGTSACVDDPGFEPQPDDTGVPVSPIASATNDGDPGATDVDDLDFDVDFDLDLDDEVYAEEPDGMNGIMECKPAARVKNTSDVRNPCAPR